MTIKNFELLIMLLYSLLYQKLDSYDTTIPVIFLDEIGLK